MKHIFSRWRPSWISDRNDFSNFGSTSPLPSFKSFGLLGQEKKRKIDFQDDGHVGHLGFPFEMILTLFDV